MFGYIYKCTNLLNGKIYIGKREKDQFDENYYGSGRDWRLALSDCGKENVEREILEWCESRKQLNQREIFWIGYYNSTDKNIGYNIHKGGQGGNSLGDKQLWSKLHLGSRNGRYGKPVSSETRKKISEANTGRKFSKEVNLKKGRPGQKKPEGFAEKVSERMKGKVVSKETRDKVSQSLKGRLHPISEETKHKISESLKGHAGLSGAKNGMYGKKHSEESIQKMKQSLYGKRAGAKNPRARKVICVETGVIYQCIKDAELATGLTTISSCCKGEIKECKKNHTHWRYVDE